MGLIDSILNLMGLLLWIGWRSAPSGLPDKPPALTLASTLQKPESHRGSRWISLASLGALLLFRGLFYWNIGSTVNWTPSLELGAVSLPFRSDYLGRDVLYSLLSFALVLGTFYAWLLLVAAINRNVPNEQPLQRVVRHHLGFVNRWPTILKLVLPAVAMALLWALASPGLVKMGILPSPHSTWQVWQQAALLGINSFLVWKFLILAVCLLYLLNSYVYLGDSSFWTFINLTGTNLLHPLRRMRLCVGKFDLSPIAGILLVLVATRWMAQWLPRAFQRLPL